MKIALLNTGAHINRMAVALIALSVAVSATFGVELMTASFYGPLIYMVLYVRRPVLFFPATILTLLGGFLFGPVLGVIYTILGSNSSAMVAYTVGRYFGQGVLENEADSNLIQRYTSRMRHNSFETVLIMRLIFLPYDLVNYAAGFLQINWKST